MSAPTDVKPRCSVLFPKITLTRLIRSNHLRDLHGLVLAGRYFLDTEPRLFVMSSLVVLYCSQK